MADTKRDKSSEFRPDSIMCNNSQNLSKDELQRITGGDTCSIRKVETAVKKRCKAGLNAIEEILYDEMIEVDL